MHDLFCTFAGFCRCVSDPDLLVRNLNNYLEYARLRPDTSCFVIDTKNVNKASKILKNLRADRHSSVKPLFLLRSLGDASDRLSERVVDTLEEAFERAESIDRLLQELDRKSLEDPESDSSYISLSKKEFYSLAGK